jgi:hypothetical protein
MKSFIWSVTPLLGGCVVAGVVGGFVVPDVAGGDVDEQAVPATASAAIRMRKRLALAVREVVMTEVRPSSLIGFPG